MASIGSLSITAWRGTIVGEMKPVEIVRRAGVDGTGLLVGAYASTPVTIETDYIDTLANVQAWTTTALTYPGTSISVTDAMGDTWSDTAILDLTYSYLRVKSAGVSAYLVRATWTMMVDY